MEVDVGLNDNHRTRSMIELGEKREMNVLPKEVVYGVLATTSV